MIARIPLVAMLASVVLLAVPRLTASPDLPEGLPQAMFVTVARVLPISDLGPEQSCVVRIWHQRCSVGTHTADESAAGTHANKHDVCIGNPDPNDWCAGHPSCSSSAALADFHRLSQLAFAALDGQPGALSTLQARYPGFVRHNQALDSYDILDCDQGAVFAAIPIAERAGAHRAE